MECDDEGRLGPHRRSVAQERCFLGMKEIARPCAQDLLGTSSCTHSRTFLQTPPAPPWSESTGGQGQRSSPGQRAARAPHIVGRVHE